MAEIGVQELLQSSFDNLCKFKIKRIIQPLQNRFSIVAQ